MYKSENKLVKDFTKLIKNKPDNPFSLQKVASEFNYRNGKTDIIGKNYDDDIIAIEAKLIKWKDAMYQAYKNTIYAHFSYVLIPFENIVLALKQIHEFKKRGIGLCSYQNGIIEILYKPNKIIPYNSLLTEVALKYINNK